MAVLKFRKGEYAENYGERADQYRAFAQNRPYVQPLRHDRQGRPYQVPSNPPEYRQRRSKDSRVEEGVVAVGIFAFAAEVLGI